MKLRSFAALVALCGLAWALSALALRWHLQDQAIADRSWHQRGISQLQFPLASRSDLIGGRALDVESQRFGSDGLHLRFGPGAANLPIGFDGRCLDSRRFPILNLHVQASTALTLALVQSPLAGGEQRLTELPVASGRQQLRVDLRELDWRVDAAGQSRRAALGDEDGRVCEFRLVPVADRAASLSLANLRFSLPAGVSASQAWADAAALEWRWRRPESVLLERDRLRTHADVELWPQSVPGVAQTSTAPLRRWPGYLGLLAGFIAMGVALATEHRRWTVVAALAGPIWLLASNRIGTASGPLDWLALAASGMALLLGLRRQTLPAIRWLGSAAAWREALAGLALVLTAAVLLHWLAGQPLRGAPSSTDLLRYLLWAALQQLLLQRVLIPVLNGKQAAILSGMPAAAAFALLHMPNLSLMALCMLAGLWWSDHHQRHRSYLPLVVIHAALGVALSMLLPASWLYSAEVGERFFTAPGGS